MNVRICDTPHENIEYLAEIINEIHNKVKNGYWFISDIDIIPKFKGDYRGNGSKEIKNLCVEFKDKMEKQNTAIFSHSELIELLNDTQTIYRAVLIYFDKNVEINSQTFNPMVDSGEQNKGSHEEALYEIKILDGDMFVLFDNL